MRVLFALHQFFPEHRAGTEIVTLTLARELRARGHDPCVLAARRSRPFSDLSPGEIEDYEVEGIPVRRVGRPTETPRRPYHLDYRNEAMARRARDYAREMAPDVVHVMHLQALSTSVIGVFKGLDLPIVYTATDYWAVCPVADLRRHDGTICAGPELEHCIRCVASGQVRSRTRALLDHTPDAVLRATGRLSETSLSRAFLPLRQVRDLSRRPAHIRKMIDRVDRVTAPSRFMREMLASHGVGGDAIQVSPHGIETRDMPARSERPRQAASPLRVGFAGTLAPHKGCDILIRAFKRLPRSLDAKLTIHGNLERFRPYVEQLRGLAGSDARIAFAGAFPSGEAGRALSGIDVLVVPSRWYENAPLVINEAFAAGVPVVATNLGGMAEAVAPERDGLLFELENEVDLARQLLRLAEEGDLLERLRAGIRPVKTVQEDVDGLERLYDSVVDEKARTNSR